MKPPPFDYHVPDTVEEACEIKRQHGPEARALAGGQSLIPLMSSRRMTPRVLIDIKRIAQLQAHGRDNGALVVGAAVRQSQLHDDPEIGGVLPLLADAARYIGHLETRHRGTVGGSLAHADPVAELPTVAVGIGAEIVARSSAGERRIPASEFVSGARQTTLADDELVVGVRYPVLADGLGWGFAELARRHADAAMATAVALVELDPDGAVVTASVTVGAVAGRPRRLEGLEGALAGAPATRERIAEAAKAAADVTEPDPGPGDPGPTPQPPRVPLSYRRRLATAAAAQALTQAAERANGRDKS